MSYAGNHARAFALVARKGATVSFNTGTPGTYDPTDDSFSSPTSSTVTGVAVAIPPSPADLERYRAAGLVVDRVVTLQFVPTTFGQTPVVDATVTWNSETLTVRDLEPIAPSGTIISTKVACVR